MSDRPGPVDAARALVAERFPEAIGAWLGGSAATDRATATSDLDLTVLRAEGSTGRESLEHAGWPVELFVHTAASVRYYLAKEREHRRPTMARLVGEGLVLVGGAAADDLAAECRAALAAGPPPLDRAALDARRYALSDLLDDLAGGGPPDEVAAIAVETWRAACELRLCLDDRWLGTGKWLARELVAEDPETAARLRTGLTAALTGDPTPLAAAATDVLDRAGGRLWAGYAASSEAPPVEEVAQQPSPPVEEVAQQPSRNP